MLPICDKIDKAGYWSVEVWGGATFDACIRFLGEDPWERLRRFRKALPNTRTQMLLRGQNMLGYRHYADDVVDAFVEKAAENGMDVFRIFDALNDMRNVEAAVRAVLKTDGHAQGAISYTISPVHTMDTWVDLGKRLEDMGCHSVCIKDMAGLIKPYVAEEMVSRLKETLSAPIALHSHATTGMSTAAIVKAVEAGVDMADAAISSMSHTYGHSATESIVAILEGGDRDTGMDLGLLEEIASYFRGVRKKYARFEGSLRGIDARILTAQVPGGMLTNMENQLREQGATDRFDEVLEEMPSVREELGFIPLVTPTSQIVGTQSIVNVLSGERYKTITRQTAGVLRGEYGRTPAPVDADLQKRALNGDDPVTCRPADLLSPEMGKLTADVDRLAKEEGFRRADDPVEDVLTYALFDQVGLKFLKNRNDPSAFEPPPWEDEPAAVPPAGPAATPAAPGGDRGAGRRRRTGPIPGERQRDGLRCRGQPRGRRRFDPAGEPARLRVRAGRRPRAVRRPRAGRFRRGAAVAALGNGAGRPRAARAGDCRRRRRPRARGDEDGDQRQRPPLGPRRLDRRPGGRPGPEGRPPALHLLAARDETSRCTAPGGPERKPKRGVHRGPNAAGTHAAGSRTHGTRRMQSDLLLRLWETTGLANFGGIGPIAMMAVGGGLIYLGISRRFEPLLLIPIGFGAILSNIPVADIGGPDGILGYFYSVGVSTGIFPLLIFLGVGALTDFGALIANPKTLMLGAAAQFGIFFTLLGSLAMSELVPAIDFSLQDAAAIGIIGGADGPTAIFLASRLSPDLLGAIAVAAYSYMALVPIIQPPIMRALTTEEERAVAMDELRPVSATERILFPFTVLLLVVLLLPAASPSSACSCSATSSARRGGRAAVADRAERAHQHRDHPARPDRRLAPRRRHLPLHRDHRHPRHRPRGVRRRHRHRRPHGQGHAPPERRAGQPPDRRRRGLGRAHGRPRRQPRGPRGQPEQPPPDARHGPERGRRHRLGGGRRLPAVAAGVVVCAVERVRTLGGTGADAWVERVRALGGTGADAGRVGWAPSGGRHITLRRVRRNIVSPEFPRSCPGSSGKFRRDKMTRTAFCRNEIRSTAGDRRRRTPVRDRPPAGRRRRPRRRPAPARALDPERPAPPAAAGAVCAGASLSPTCAHPFVVANRLVAGSYVSGLSALAHAQRIPEYVPEVTSVAAARPELRSTALGRFSFRHLKGDLLFGYRSVEVGRRQQAFVARPEKALLDLVHLCPGGDESPHLAGLRLDLDASTWT